MKTRSVDMVSRFVQIAPAPHSPGGVVILYALDEAGDVWKLDPGDTAQSSRRERWTRVTAERDE
jgi:hypothetical protein